MSRSPPLRFLVLLLAGWTGIRTAWLAPPFWSPPAGAGPRAQPAGASGRRAVAAPLGAGPASLRPRTRPGRVPATPPTVRRRPPSAILGEAWTGPAPPASAERARAPAPAVAKASLPASPPFPAAAGAAPASASRWSFAAWSFLRAGDSAPLAGGGRLGGSQAGLRFAYRLNRDRARPLAVAARLTSALRRPAAAEAALGLDWQPWSGVPVHLVAERRQRLGRHGRSAFGLTVHGGVGDAPLGPLRVDAYAQAGIVGVRSRDRFGDGALLVSLPLGGRARLGAGAWAAAQPGAARLDLGPQASLRLPLAGRNVTVAADWRQRVAGDAHPGSGPTLTLATDF